MNKNNIKIQIVAHLTCEPAHIFKMVYFHIFIITKHKRHIIVK